jgi:hypothetical protein
MSSPDLDLGISLFTFIDKNLANSLTTGSRARLIETAVDVRFDTKNSQTSTKSVR